MLYHFVYQFVQELSVFNVFRYITFRSFVAFLLSALIAMVWGYFFIQYMKQKQFGQIVRSDGPQSHLKKAGTPTMGGIFIFGSVLLTLVVVGNYFSKPLWAVLFTGVSYFVLGGIDDYLKVLRKDPTGVVPRAKLAWQFGTALLVCYFAYSTKIVTTELYIPFVKGPILDLGLFFIPFGAFVIVGSSNAVNLTDGLDGLAIGPIITSASSLGLLAYVAGHKEIAGYLYIPYIEGAGELTVLCAAIIGAGVGFLWYNTYPAQIFMGDAGSLSLGGVLGAISVFTKNEFLFALIGGVFVIEAVSVILQVGSYKIRKKRIFKMAPIHHHFELLGWPEPKVIVRFWILSICLAIFAIATLKLR
ncbi:MAG: phospho-N-acetylmuramoyl-pentapeptide-transferase [Bdellovibrionales bacterium GWA2_49_15]|nr:MAG: phospho-N-acetylmuramoyl-pentapeptide-transferase [Bdellovibrionales bacterium GWA2_49_15]